MEFKEWWELSGSKLTNKVGWGKMAIAEISWQRGRMEYIRELKDLITELDRRMNNGTL